MQIELHEVFPRLEEWSPDQKLYLETTFLCLEAAVRDPNWWAPGTRCRVYYPNGPSYFVSETYETIRTLITNARIIQAAPPNQYSCMGLVDCPDCGGSITLGSLAPDAPK